jgi:hypothetical protein
MKYPTLLGPTPEISFVDNLVFTFGSLGDSADGDEIRNNGKTTLGRRLAPHVRVQHAQPVPPSTESKGNARRKA